MKKNFNGRTYYDLLAVYFERQYQVPLSANEQALMTHIMHLCNFARSNSITTTHSKLAMVSNLKRSHIGQWLGNLTEKGYISAQSEPNNCTRIALKLPLNCPEINENIQAESDISDAKKRKEQIRQEKKEDFSEKKSSVNLEDYMKAKRKLKADGKTEITYDDVMAQIADEINDE